MKINHKIKKSGLLIIIPSELIIAFSNCQGINTEKNQLVSLSMQYGEYFPGGKSTTMHLNFVEDTGSILSTFSGINPEYEYPWKSVVLSVISKIKQLIKKLDLEKIENSNKTYIEENPKVTTININTKNKSYKFILTENDKDNYLKKIQNILQEID